MEVRCVRFLICKHMNPDYDIRNVWTVFITQLNNLTTSTKSWMYFSYKLELNWNRSRSICLSIIKMIWLLILVVFGLNIQKTFSAYQFSQWFIGFFMHARWKTFITQFWTLAKDLNMMIWQKITTLSFWNWAVPWYLIKTFNLPVCHHLRIILV